MNIDNMALEQIRARLLARRAELRRRRERIELDLSRHHEALSGDSSDRAIQLENDEPLQAIEHVAARELEDIDLALERMARGLYGICKSCGDQISAARLAAVPHATVCQYCRA
jgi:RNA polymerase-binding transcription factor DksA